MQRRGVKQRGFQSDVPTLFTRGGIKYDKTDKTQAVKGWSDEGIARFDALFDQVKQDRANYPDFEKEWLCLLYTSPSPRDLSTSRMPSSA